MFVCAPARAVHAATASVPRVSHRRFIRKLQRRRGSPRWGRRGLAAHHDSSDRSVAWSARPRSQHDPRGRSTSPSQL
eukprot:7385269-Prymnesium_polylepis.1